MLGFVSVKVGSYVGVDVCIIFRLFFFVLCCSVVVSWWGEEGMRE